jgi:hypothetical protein
VLPIIASTCGLRDTVAWPLGGSDREEIDLVAVDEQGRPVVACTRGLITLTGVGAFLDAVQSLRLALPTVLAGAAPPVRLEAPRIVLAGEAFAPGAVRALSGIALAHDLFEVGPDRGQGYTLVSIGAEEAMRSLRDRPRRRRGRGRPGDEAREPEAADEAEVEELEAEALEESAAESGRDRDRDREEGGGRGRSRRRGRRRGRGRQPAEAAGEGAPEEGEEETDERPRFEELSLFDLEEGGDDTGDEPGGARRRRGRGGRRRRRGGRGEGESGGREADAGARPSRGGEARARGGEAPGAEDEDEEDAYADEDFSEVLSELPDELEADVVETPAVAEVDEDEEDEEGEEAEERGARPARGDRGRRAPAPAGVGAHRRPRRRPPSPSRRARRDGAPSSWRARTGTRCWRPSCSRGTSGCSRGCGSIPRTS